MTTNKPNTFLILFFALTLFTMLSPVQIRAEVSLKDTLYRKGNEYCVYIDRDCNSANVKKFIDRINIDRYVSTDIQNQIGKMRDNGIRLFHFDLGHLEGTYIRLRTIGGEKVTTGYMPHITYISDSLIVWHELDSWPYAIQNVECIQSGTTVVETISYSGKPVIFTITETDFEKRVIEIRTDDEGYVPKGLYVHSATANCFPHIVWECDGEPDGIRLPFED